MFASIHARFFYKTCYKFRVPWLVEIDLEHIIAVSMRDKLQLTSCELYTLTNDLLDPVQKIFAFHVACLPIPPPPLLSGSRKKVLIRCSKSVFIQAVMLRKLLRQNAQLCFPVNTLLPLPQVSGILLAIFRNYVDKELYCAFYVNTLLPNKKCQS